MLKENIHIKQNEGERYRRWYEDEYFDLIIWYKENKQDIYGFQLCYDISSDEHVLTWKEDSGFAHERIDSGEPHPFKNMSPIMIPDGVFPVHHIMRRFEEESRKIDSKTSALVLEKLKEFSASDIK